MGRAQDSAEFKEGPVQSQAPGAYSMITAWIDVCDSTVAKLPWIFVMQDEDMSEMELRKQN